MRLKAPRDSVELLEAVASRFYPGLYVLLDQPLDGFLWRSGLRADILAGESPDFRPDSIRAIGLVRPFPIDRGRLPGDWRRILECGNGGPWRIDLFVHKRDARRVQRLVEDAASNARVLALP